LVDAAIVVETLGPAFDGFSFIPADETRGGILIAWKSSDLAVVTSNLAEFSLTVEVRSLADDKRWAVTSVYGPQSRADKIRFLDELLVVGDTMQMPWLLSGDFNLVCSEEDRAMVELIAGW
jgi:hypothetical protein